MKKTQLQKSHATVSLSVVFEPAAVLSIYVCTGFVYLQRRMYGCQQSGRINLPYTSLTVQTSPTFLFLSLY